MKLLTQKATKCLNGSKATSARTCVNVVKAILYTCGLSTDSEWSEVKTKKVAQKPPVKVGGDTLRTLRGLSDSTTPSATAAHEAEDTVPWDDMEFRREAIVMQGVQAGVGKAAGSLHPESLVASLPTRPQSAPTKRPANLGAIGFTGGGGMGFNSASTSSFSVTRGSSVGAAFDNSAKRFNTFFNMSRHHFREEKSIISSGADFAKSSNGPRHSSPGQKGPTLYQSSFSSYQREASTHPADGSDGAAEIKLQAGGGVFARSFHASHMHAGGRPHQKPPRLDSSSGGDHAPVVAGCGKHARRFEAAHMHQGTSYGEAHRLEYSPQTRVAPRTESRPGSAGSALRGESPARTRAVPRPASAQPSLQRWTGQPLGQGDNKGRSDDHGGIPLLTFSHTSASEISLSDTRKNCTASARTMVEFTRAPQDGPVRSFQRTSHQQRPHVIRHYAAQAAATRVPAAADAQRSLKNHHHIGGNTLGISRKIGASPLNGAVWAPQKVSYLTCFCLVTTRGRTRD